MQNEFLIDESHFPELLYVHSSSLLFPNVHLFTQQVPWLTDLINGSSPLHSSIDSHPQQPGCRPVIKPSTVRDDSLVEDVYNGDITRKHNSCAVVSQAEGGEGFSNVSVELCHPDILAGAISNLKLSVDDGNTCDGTQHPFESALVDGFHTFGRGMDGVGGVVVVGDNGTPAGGSSSGGGSGKTGNGVNNSNSGAGNGSGTSTQATSVAAAGSTSASNNHIHSGNSTSGNSKKKSHIQMHQQQQSQQGISPQQGSAPVSPQPQQPQQSQPLQQTQGTDQLLGGVVVSSPLHLGLTADPAAPSPAVGVTSLAAAGAAPSTSCCSSSSSSSSSSSASSSSAASVVPSFWSTASPEDTFLQGFQSLNGTVTFQQFPPNPSTLFGTGITTAPHLGGLGHMAAQQQATAPQRRAITAHHNFQQQQQQQQRQQASLLLNNSKTYPAWSSAPQPSLWTTAAAQPGGGNAGGGGQGAGGAQGQVNPNIAIPQSQHHQQQQQPPSPWGSIPQQQPPPPPPPTTSQQQQQQQRRSMPSINPVAPIKKPIFSPQAPQQQGGGQPVGPQGRHLPQGTPLPHQGPLHSNQTHAQLGQTSLISASKFHRSTSYPGQIPHQAAVGAKPSVEITSVDDQRDVVLAYQNIPREMLSDNVVLWTESGRMEYLPVDRGSNYDSMRFSGLESRLLDLMRTNSDHNDHFKGKSPFGFNEENHLLDDGTLDQTVPNMNSPARGSPNPQTVERMERFSRKVFVGGLPPDIDEEEITSAFRRFGPLVVDWPHKAESKSYFPPKGYCFLLFQDEMSVQALIDACITDDDKLYWCVSSPTMKDKPVQIRPWNLSDSDFVMDGSQPLDPRKTIFVGGVPRPLRALELAMIMDRLYGGVCYAGIDTDPELKYPKGAGRVAFSNQQSYIAAISARFVQLQHGDIDKRVEVKPYVLDDQMCDECQGARCGGKFAPFFCANVTCLQYYCEHCWATIHTRPGREFHKPLVKEGADRPRAVPFRWC